LAMGRALRKREFTFTFINKSRRHALLVQKARIE
jgi:hypothetical protein